MDKVQINLYGVLLSGLVSMIIGYLYYSDWVFGKQWKKLAKIDTKRFEKEMIVVMPALFLAALITAFTVNYFGFLFKQYFGNSWFITGVLTSLILWLGISASSIYIHNSVDQKPPVLTYLSLGNRLISILSMGMIMGLLHP
jgi:hypothetical protein